MPDPKNILPALEVMRDYPHIFPPPGFTTFDRNGLVSLNGSGEDILTKVDISSGQAGWVTQVGLECADFSLVNFAFRLNGQPLQDYTLIQVPLGSCTTPKQVYIKINANYSFTLVALKTAAVNTAVRYSIFGWYYPGFSGGF